MNDSSQQDLGNTYLCLHNLNKQYSRNGSSVIALDSLNLTLSKGEVCVILGPSGSGKTTLLNMLGAIDTPSSGSVQIDDQTLTNLDRKGLAMFRREKIGFVFQFFNLLPTLTAVENVEYALQIQGEKDARERAKEALREVGLEGRFDHFPSELSGGEQQRVAIARALAKRPSLILADEPTGELDYETGIVILELLCNLVKTNPGTTVVIVTHNSEIAQVGDRVVRLRSGKVVTNKLNPNPISPSDLRW